MKLFSRFFISLLLAFVLLTPVLALAQGPTNTSDLIWTDAEKHCWNTTSLPANGRCDPVPSSYHPIQDMCVQRGTNVLVVVKEDASGAPNCPGFATEWTIISAGSGPGNGLGNGPGNSGSAVNGGITCDFGTMDRGLCIPDNPVCKNGGSGLACSGNVMQLVSLVIDIMLYFAGIVAVIFVIIGGYMYMTSAGNTDRAGKGRTTFTNAIIGLVIVILAYVVVRVVTSFIT